MAPAVCTEQFCVSLNVITIESNGVTLNNASDYRTNELYRTPNPNPSLLVR